MRRAALALIVAFGLLVAAPAAAQTADDPFGGLSNDPFSTNPTTANDVLDVTVYLDATGQDDVEIRGVSSFDSDTARSVAVQVASALGIDKSDYEFDDNLDSSGSDPADERLLVKRHLAKQSGTEWDYTLQTSQLQRVAQINEFPNYKVYICAATSKFDTLAATVAGVDEGNDCTSWTRTTDAAPITVGVHETPSSAGFRHLIVIQVIAAVVLFLLFVGVLFALRRKNRARFFGRVTVWSILVSIVIAAFVWLCAIGLMAISPSAISENALTKNLSSTDYFISWLDAPLIPAASVLVAFLLIIFFGPRAATEPERQLQSTGGFPAWLPNAQTLTAPAQTGENSTTAAWASDLVGQRPAMPEQLQHQPQPSNEDRPAAEPDFTHPKPEQNDGPGWSAPS